MKQLIRTITASLAVLGLGLFVVGVLSIGPIDSGNLYGNSEKFAQKSDDYGETSGEMNTRGNTVLLPSGTETVLEAESGGSSENTPAEYLPQTEPPAAVPEGYTLPETVQLKDGSIGQLGIEKLGLSVPVYETADEMEAMRKGVAHYPSTSAWAGNIGMCAHSGTGPSCFFRDLHKLKPGDEITYTTALGTRQYVVDVVKEIAETDWSMLGRGARCPRCQYASGTSEKHCHSGPVSFRGLNPRRPKIRSSVPNCTFQRSCVYNAPKLWDVGLQQNVT